MKKILSETQLEEMVATAVKEVLAEDKKKVQKKTQRKQVNESQLADIIKSVINEELENEGLWGKLKGGAQGLGGGGN